MVNADRIEVSVNDEHIQQTANTDEAYICNERAKIRNIQNTQESKKFQYSQYASLENIIATINDFDIRQDAESLHESAHFQAEASAPVEIRVTAN